MVFNKIEFYCETKLTLSSLPRIRLCVINREGLKRLNENARNQRKLCLSRDRFAQFISTTENYPVENNLFLTRIDLKESRVQTKWWHNFLKQCVYSLSLFISMPRKIYKQDHVFAIEGFG